MVLLLCTLIVTLNWTIKQIFDMFARCKPKVTPKSETSRNCQFGLIPNLEACMVKFGDSFTGKIAAFIIIAICICIN